jgi:hypothetical protein
MVHFQLLLRLLKASVFLLVVAAIAVAVAATSLSIVDLFACILAFVPTGWGILSVSFNLLIFLFLFCSRLVDCFSIIGVIILLNHRPSTNGNRSRLFTEWCGLSSKRGI